MPSVEFEPEIPTIKRSHTYGFELANSGNGACKLSNNQTGAKVSRQNFDIK